MSDDDYQDDDEREAERPEVVSGPLGAQIEVGAPDDDDDDAGTFDVVYTPKKNLAFKLRVLDEDGGVLETARFEVLPSPGAAGQIALAQVVRYNERGRQVYDVPAVMFFFETVMPDTDYERLLLHMQRKDGKRISDDQLVQAAGWIIQQYGIGEMANYGGNGARPTQPSQRLRGDRLPTSRSSKGRRR